MRLDRFNKKWRRTAERPYDTPLHESGFEQAEKMGAFLKDKGIKHIFASPLLRAIQTAHTIAQHLSLPVKLEPALVEHLKRNWFPDSGPNGPRVMPLDEVVTDYPLVDEEYKSQTVLRFPESRQHVIDRTKRICEMLISKYDSHLLLVGHGRSVQHSVQFFVGYKTKVKPKCAGLYKVSRDNRDWALEIDNQPF